MKTKIIWPLDTPDEMTLTENPDGSKSASYVDVQGQAKTVVINPDGSRDQTVSKANGQWTIRYEITEDGVLLQRTEFTDGTVWLVSMHPGTITHVIAYHSPDGTASERTYYTSGLRKDLDKAADGRTTTVITNEDGLQRIATQP